MAMAGRSIAAARCSTPTRSASSTSRIACRTTPRKPTIPRWSRPRCCSVSPPKARRLRRSRRPRKRRDATLLSPHVIPGRATWREPGIHNHDREYGFRACAQGGASRNDGLSSGAKTMSAMLLAQQILNGLLDGVYYLLIALGLSLIFSLGGIVNLAHGAFFAIGAYLTLVVSPYLGFGGAFVVAPVTVALLGVVIERLLFTRFYRSDPILSLLMTFGLAMVAEQVLRMIFGAPPLSYSIPQSLRGQVALGSFIYSFYRIVLLGVAVTCIAGLWVLLQKTSFGRVVRAGVQNPDMVGALGISLQPYMSAVAALGIGLAGLAGVLLAPIYAVHPAMGQEIITPAFVVVVIGGLGSFWGVVAAALLVGLVKGVMVGIGYSAASTAAIYLLMLLVLLFRPRGLFGERITRFE